MSWSLSGRAEHRAGAPTGSPAGQSSLHMDGVRHGSAARPLSDQSLTEEKAGSARASSRETSRADSDGRATTLVTEMSQGASSSVSDRPLTPEGDGKSGLHGGSFSPSDVSGRPLMEGAAARYSGSRPIRGNAVSSPPSVRGPYSRAVHTDPLSAAPAAQLTAPGPWLQESLPVPGQLTLSEEAA